MILSSASVNKNRIKTNRTYMTVEISRNSERNGIEIRFMYKPDDDILDYLRSRGWRWSSYKGCWYHYYSEQHMRDAEYVKNECSGSSLYTSYRETSYSKSNRIEERPKSYEKLLEKKIESNALIIKKHSFSMKEKANLEEVCAVFYVVKYNDEIIEVCAPAFHKVETNEYFIFEEDFGGIERYGTPLCRRLDYDVYVKQGEANNDYSYLAKESLIHSLGYNVDAKNDLSAAQRQRILEYAICEGFFVKEQLLSFLSWLASRGRNNNGLQEAVAKWDEDRQWVSQYQLSNKKRYIPNVIIERRYIKY